MPPYRGKKKSFFFSPPPPPKASYVDVVVGLARSYDPESYPT